jgi:hypothetical protein
MEASMGWNYPVIAGSQAKAKAIDEGPGTIALDLLPDARQFLRLPPSLLTTDLAPIYGRGPDARLPATAP